MKKSIIVTFIVACVFSWIVFKIIKVLFLPVLIGGIVYYIYKKVVSKG